MGHARGGGLAQAALRCGPRWAPARACGARSGLGRASGSAQSGRVDFLFFEFIFNVKTNSSKVLKLFKGTKKTRKITKIPGKFLEIDYDMNNPNKAFGAHEKDFRAF
jgi:hypothetical protein